MKSFFYGMRKVFSFTFRQRVINKGWRMATAIVTILALLLPPLIMGTIEYFGGNDEETAAAPVDTVYVADVSGGEEFDFTMLATLASSMDYPQYAGTSYILSEADNADDDSWAAAQAAIKAAGAARDNALALILTRENEGYQASVVLPEGSALTMEDTDCYTDFLDKTFQIVLLMKSGVSMNKLMQLSAINFQYSFYTNDNGTEVLTGGDEASEAQNLDAMVKDILGYFIPFTNIMLLYFLILFYGQGTANSVVMEKASKLMDTLLLSVRPGAMIVGKVLAQACCCILQVGLWVLGLIGGFRLGIQAVEAINPDTTMPIIAMFESMGLLAEIFKPVHIVFFLLYLAAGLLLYLALSAIGGAIAGKQEDLNMTNTLFVLVLIASFFLVLSTNMSGLAASSWMDWLPFTSILITPGHIFLGSFSIPQACASLVIVLAAALLVMLLAGKIYKAMAMYKGNLPKPKELIQLLFSK